MSFGFNLEGRIVFFIAETDVFLVAEFPIPAPRTQPPPPILSQFLAHYGWFVLVSHF